MTRDIEKDIFKKGSVTYYLSTRFFPKDIREDVARLYSFVRTADDYVDGIPQNAKEFQVLRGLWDDACVDTRFDDMRHIEDTLNLRVVKNMIHLSRKYKFDDEWVDSFFQSMQADIDSRTYATLDGMLWYVYGSAEVIGLMMAKIMGLPDDALEFAQMQGRAMQMINFIRDISEDNILGRCYFPQEELEAYGLKDLSRQSANDNQERFKDFIHLQLHRYIEWQSFAQQGFDLIPKKYRTALQTAVDMYNWTGRTIANDPMIIYERKVKPSRRQLLTHGARLVVVKGS